MARIALYDEEQLTGPKQREMARFIWERKVVSVQDLKDHFKTADRLLKLLCERGVVQIEKVRAFRQLGAGMSPSPRPDSLTAHQEAAIERIGAAVNSGVFTPFLLHGVTGSGKTEVYMNAVQYTLDKGRGTLILVPEIALTPQLMASFESRFPNKVAVLHSALGRGERYDQWCQVAEGKLPIVLGARSAIFAPMPDIGLLVVDEEHEPSFKQDERPFYNARDLALVRAKMSGAAVVLGSATPSLESFRNARSGRYQLLELPDRATRRPLPDVVLVDLRKVGHVDSEKVFSQPLAAAMQENLEQGNQTILFLNRKGFAAFLLCEVCGAVPRCPHCDISLTYYRKSGALKCHYCQFGRQAPESCPTCGAEEGLRQIGFGTERVVEAIEQFLPTARVERLDGSVTSGRKLTSILDSFRRKEVDILVGTQIVAKGHDFPGVTLVGVLLADLGLSFPDLRASERTFQLLTQVAGRAGRGDRPGSVLVQTYIPTHYALVHSQRHDFRGFAEEELDHRRMRHFPPFAFLALVKLSGQKLAQVRSTASKTRNLLMKAAQQAGVSVNIVGPELAPMAYIRNRFRMQILLKTTNRTAMQEFLKSGNRVLLKEFGRRGAVRWNIDVDPMNLM